MKKSLQHCDGLHSADDIFKKKGIIKEGQSWDQCNVIKGTKINDMYLLACTKGKEVFLMVINEAKQERHKKKQRFEEIRNQANMK